MTDFSMATPGYHRWGNARGHPFVMLHSLGLDGASFQWLAARLADRADVQVIAPDLRGHGRHRAGQPISIDAMAADVLALIDRLNLGRVHLLGTSMGVAVARRAVERAPARWLSATLIAGAPAAIPALAQRGDAALANGMESVVAATIQRWFDAEAVEQDDEYVRYARSCLLSMRPESWAASWAAMASYPLLQRLPATVPGLCIAGDQDVSATPGIVEALRLAAGVTPPVHTIRGGCHQLALSKAADVAAVLAGRWLIN